MASPVPKRHPDNPVVFFDITLGGKLNTAAFSQPTISASLAVENCSVQRPVS